MTFNHTQGQWKADTNLGCKRISVKSSKAGKQVKRDSIACTDGLANEKEDRANALLMAAAPDMLDALMAVVHWWNEEKVSLFPKHIINLAVNKATKSKVRETKK
jgi:hypothetical protein